MYANSLSSHFHSTPIQTPPPKFASKHTNSGTNRNQWNAMDLQMPNLPIKNVPNGADMQTLSARNVLIRKKLTERKRFDSADYVLAQNEEKNDEKRELPLPNEESNNQNEDFQYDSSRYGMLAKCRPNDAILSARNLLMQKKLYEKRHFDSADYQMEQYKCQNPETSMNSSANDTLQSAKQVAEENINKRNDIMNVSEESDYDQPQCHGNNDI